MQGANSTDLAPPPGTSAAQSEREEKKPSSAEAPEQQALFVRAQRRKLPDERKSITHKFSIGGHEGYIIVGMHEEGGPGEIFIKMAKEGSTLSGFMDGLALSISIGLQYGAPLKALVDNLPLVPSWLSENRDRATKGFLCAEPLFLSQRGHRVSLRPGARPRTASFPKYLTRRAGEEAPGQNRTDRQTRWLLGYQR
jgi:hypothetical protein